MTEPVPIEEFIELIQGEPLREYQVKRLRQLAAEHNIIIAHRSSAKGSKASLRFAALLEQQLLSAKVLVDRPHRGKYTNRKERWR